MRVVWQWVRDEMYAGVRAAGYDDLNAAHDQLDLALERIGTALEWADAEAEGQPREQRPAIH